MAIKQFISLRRSSAFPLVLKAAKVNGKMQRICLDIPDCKTLPDVSHCTGIYKLTEYLHNNTTGSVLMFSVSIVNSPSSSSIASINCSEHFVLIGNHCLPACPSWILRNDQSNAEDIILIVALLIGLICGVLVIFVMEENVCCFDMH